MLQWSTKLATLLRDWWNIWFKNMKQEAFLSWNLFPKLVTDTKKDNMRHGYEPVTMKQVVKRSIAVIILKNFYERKLRNLINKTGDVRTT
jgi:hypothetical protein